MPTNEDSELQTRGLYIMLSCRPSLNWLGHHTLCLSQLLLEPTGALYPYSPLTHVYIWATVRLEWATPIFNHFWDIFCLRWWVKYAFTVWQHDELIKAHTVKSHLVVQFDKFNGHASVAISCASSPVTLLFGITDFFYLNTSISSKYFILVHSFYYILLLGILIHRN